MKCFSPRPKQDRNRDRDRENFLIEEMMAEAV